MSELGASRPSNMLCHAEQALLTTTALGWWSCWRIPNCETKPLTNRQASATSSRNGSWRSCPPSPGPSRAQHQNLGIKRCSWRNQLYPLVIKRGNGKSLTCGKTYKTSEHVQSIRMLEVYNPQLRGIHGFCRILGLCPSQSACDICDIRRCTAMLL